MGLETVGLEHVMLGSNPGADLDADGGWPHLAARRWDVRRERREGWSDWSLACHHGRLDGRNDGLEVVSRGTVGWIHRWAGSGLGELGGIIVFAGGPRPEAEPRGRAWYCRGWLLVLDEPIAGEDIAAQHGWSGAAPYHHGRARQFQSGRRVSVTDATLMEGLLRGDDLRRFTAARESVKTAVSTPARASSDPTSRPRRGRRARHLGLRPAPSLARS